MVGRRVRAWMLATGTIAGWGVLIWDALPLPDIAGGGSGFAIAAATSGTVTLALKASARPTVEVYEMGFNAGRLQAKINAKKVSQNVVRFRSRASR